MRLKHYQEKALQALKTYLGALDAAKQEFVELLQYKPSLAKHVDFAKEAWQNATGKNIYHPKTNGLGEPLPDVYLKIPTGGGKTLLACHSVGLIQQAYLKKQTGLVLWIVPSTQIYRQTILALKNREHPYRQVLDISSGGRVLVKEKTELFTPADVSENLVVLMLMLPSANRQNKETLKVFKDSGGFAGFFPEEDNYAAQQAMLAQIPNLDCFGNKDEVFGTQIKTSLGNTLKLLKPLVVVDEGHRAYADNARSTVRNFNPSFILELSATPPPESNQLVTINGRELHEEEMIKLDIHLVNKQSPDWKSTMLASFEKRHELEKKAKEYEENTGEYIRPICLVQVERTGKEQRASGLIHAEDAKEYLIKQCNVPEEQIAIKSSEKDDIEGIDLFSRACPIRYIITKQALQEGWDCSFAYLLTILTNPNSPTGITQLVGRILRQPKAVKTKIKELDECYIFTYKPNAGQLVKDIKAGLESEGLGDIAGRLVADEGSNNNGELAEKEVDYRPGFKKFEGKIYLPKFVIQEKEYWRDLIFEADILNGIDWETMDVSGIGDLNLSDTINREQEFVLSLAQQQKDLLDQKMLFEREGTLEVDEAFLARQIADIVPNPWVCYQLAINALSLLQGKYEKEKIAANFVFVIEQLKKILEKQKNLLAEKVFKNLLQQRKLHFFLLQGKGGYVLPNRIKVKGNKQLVRNNNTPVQKTLFDGVTEEDVNVLEKSVAVYLDEQEQLLWWYRNQVGNDNFHIQGWQKNKIWPDFIAAKNVEAENEYNTVYVLETKGIHLKANDDTRYKENVFALCNELGAKKQWKDLFDEFPDHKFEFQVILGDEWQNKINALMS